MIMNDNTSSMLIQNLCDNIRSACSDNLCSPIKECSESCQRILNATSILLNDAIIIQNKEKSVSNCSVDEIASILQAILILLSDTDNIINIESKIANVLVNYNISPNTLLFLPPWNNDFF